ncbi:hypothetical protein Tco_0467500 [Tanacetum coccineum]
MCMQSYSNQIGIHFPNPDKSLQFRLIEVSESENIFLDHIHGEDKNVEDVQMADHLRPMEELLQIPIIAIKDAIVVLAILANEFELKIELLDFITGQDSLNSAAGGNLMTRNTQEAFTTIENKTKVQTCRNKPQVSSSGGTSTQIDAITALTKQVEALEYHIASMRETYDQNQETPIQLMQNQMVQLEEAFQERSLENFQALENPTGHVDHFVYRIDIVDSLCDKFPIENNSLSGSPTPSSDSVVESLSPLPTPFRDSDSLLEETDTLLSHYDDSLPSYEAFCFDIEEKSSDNTTSQSDNYFIKYESFCFDIDHQEEKSSGSTTSHSDLSLPEYESFHFALSIDPLPPVDRSDSFLEEFADELAHIISPPKYDHFYFNLEDISSLDPPESTLVIDESTLLVTPLPNSKENSLKEVKRFDPFSPRHSRVRRQG